MINLLFIRDILNELKDLCEKGTTKQAKLALNSLAKIYKTATKEQTKIFNDLLNVCNF